MKLTLVLLPGLNDMEGLFAPLIKNAPHDITVMPISYPTHEKQPYSELTELIIRKIESIYRFYIILRESSSGPSSLFAAERRPKI